MRGYLCTLVLMALALPGHAGETRAISGMELIVDGHQFYLEGLRCPHPETEEGRRAKALLNTMLRSDDVYCETYQVRGRPWFGVCDIDGRDPAAMLRNSGLCL